MRRRMWERLRKVEEQMMNDCPDCLSPMEAASMGINPCRQCGETCNCKRAGCAAWKLFEEKGNQAGGDVKSCGQWDVGGGR